MNAVARTYDAPAETEISFVDVFAARCEARAMLVAAGELDLHESIDTLQAAALSYGLVAMLGQDEVQSVLADAFWWVPR